MCRETAAQVHLGKLEMEEEISVRVDAGDQMDEVDHGEEIYFDQQEELLPLLQEQDPEFLEEDAWNLEEENDYFDTEEEISPFDLF